MSRQPGHFYEFGPFRLDASQRTLTRDGKIVPLTLKAFDTLLALVENSGRIMEKEELLNRVWPHTFVEEGVLSVNIFALRKSLAEGDDSVQFIETIPRRGYRFAASVREIVEEASAKSSSPARSIAVLPFKSLSANAEDEYLGLGIADALITRLGKLKELVVRPTSAVRKHAGADRDAAEVGRELAVASVLEGSIRRAGDRVRVTVQLVGVDYGAPLWAEKFDESFTDIFSVEDRISELVAQALMIELSADERAKLGRRATSDSEAYRLYLKGRFFWNKRTEEGLSKAIEYFERAVETDPSFALAYAGLADSHLAGIGRLAPKEIMPDAKAAAIRAVELDDQLGEARTSLARIKMSFDWDWAGAASDFKRALELSPNYATAHQWYANFLLAAGRVSQALEEIKTAQELDPASVVISSAVGWVHYLARDYDEAISAYKKAIEMDANFVQAWREMGMVYERKGMRAEAVRAISKAIEIGGANPLVSLLLAHVLIASGEKDEALGIIERLKRRNKECYVSPLMFALTANGLGERENTLDWLEKAYEDRSSPLMWLKLDPNFDNLRDDPRFKDLLRRMYLA